MDWTLVIALGALAVSLAGVGLERRTQKRVLELERAALAREQERLVLELRLKSERLGVELRLAELEQPKRLPRLWIDPLVSRVEVRRQVPGLWVAVRVENRGGRDAPGVRVEVSLPDGTLIPQFGPQPVRAHDEALFELHQLPLASVEAGRLTESVHLRFWCEQSGAEAHWP